jgi:hypothetical protein
LVEAAATDELTMNNPGMGFNTREAHVQQHP